MKISKYFAFSAMAFGALAMSACGGGGSDDDTDGPPIVVDPVDAPPGSDIDAPPGSDIDGMDMTGNAECNPITQTGCATDERCTWIEESATLSYTGCTANGTVQEGEVCTDMPGPEMGTDNCVAGTLCNGVCQEICTTSPDSCGEDGACNLYNGLFTDVANAGLCSALCDPVAQDCAAPGTACYLGISNGKSTCVPAGDEMLTQGDDCMFLNSCDPGFGCHIAKGDGSGLGVCTAYCTPVEGDLDGADDADCFSVGSGDGECNFVSTLFGDNPQVPNTIGICLENRTDQNGDPVTCADHDPMADPPVIIAGCGPNPGSTGRAAAPAHALEATPATIRAIADGALQ